MKTQSTHTARWLFILALLGVLVLASCNRSATQGIFPEDVTVEETTEDVTVEETTVEESGEAEADLETPDTTMEALLEDDLAANVEGIEDQSVDEEAASAEGATEGAEQLEAESETIAEPLSGEETDAEAGTGLAATEPGTSDDGTLIVIDAPVIGNAPATYVVLQGDWVYKIARVFNIAPLDLLAANPVIGADQQVYPGQELIIPGDNLEPTGGEQGSVEGATIMAPAGAAPASTYEVKAGDTVFSIALNHGIAVDVLAENNDIAAPYLIYVGQSLVIPSQ